MLPVAPVKPKETRAVIRCDQQSDLNTHGKVVLDAGSDTGNELQEERSACKQNIGATTGVIARTNLQEHNQVLIHTNSHLLVSNIMRNLLPFGIFARSGLDSVRVRPADIQLVDLVHETLHPLLAARSLAGLHLITAQLEGGIGTVQQRLHDGGMAAGVHAGHLDAVGEEGEVFERYGLVLVVADDVFHHQMRGERLPVGKVARHVHARALVGVGVGDVEGVGAFSTVGKRWSG